MNDLEVNIMNANKFLMLAATALVIAGCSGSDTVPANAGGNNAFGGAGAGGGNVGGSGAQTSGAGAGFGNEFVPFDGALPGDEDLIQNLVLYFEFDSSEIRSEFNSMLAAHGRYLASDPNSSVRLEGHADERGSREYNIGLGENRAQAVRQILLLQGVSSAQISTVSYGEERPAAFGSDEESYGLNRRVELVYR
jgi:peptidoglycan-associated lipoprotein